MDPLVSIIVPAYNAASTIAGAVSSALGQTEPRVEVVVVDDGSHDATAAIAEAHGPRVRVIRQANAGVAAARNAGMRAARGPFFAWLDADDLMLPHHVASSLSLLAAADRALVASDGLRLGPDGLERGSMLPHGAVAPARLRTLVLRENPIPYFCLFPRALWTELGGLDETLRRNEDWEFWARAVLSGWEVRFKTTPSVLYRVQAGSLSSDDDAMLEAEDAMILSLGEKVAASLRPEERAFLRRRAERGSWYRLTNAARDALAAGDAPTASARYADAARLDPADAGVRLRATLLGLPVAGPTLARFAARRTQPVARAASTPDDRLVSVVVPAHNAAATLGQALTGALTQSHPNVEVVVVDDGSTDHTAAIAQAHGPRVRVIRQQQGGVAAARNAGLAAANGSHVVLCDADDVLLPDHITRALSALDAAGPRHFVASQAFILNERGVRTGEVLGFTPIPDDRQRATLLEGNIIPIHVMLPRALLLEVGAMDTALDRCEDWQYWIRAALLRWRVAFQMVPTALHRTTPGSLSSHEASMWDAEERMIAALAEHHGALLTPEEHAYLARRTAAGSPLRLRAEASAALAAGDTHTAREKLTLADHLDPRNTGARLKARLLHVPPLARLLTLRERAVSAHREGTSS